MKPGEPAGTSRVHCADALPPSRSESANSTSAPGSSALALAVEPTSTTRTGWAISVLTRAVQTPVGTVADGTIVNSCSSEPLGLLAALLAPLPGPCASTGPAASTFTLDAHGGTRNRKEKTPFSPTSGVSMARTNGARP